MRYAKTLFKSLRKNAPESADTGIRHTYSPIHGLQGIRLLSLQPGRFLDPLQCYIDNVSLSDNPQYEALSYTWGDLELEVPIICLPSRHVLLVTKNCGSALRRLRYTYHCRSLWVDSICINQDDWDERAQEVSRMNKIFGMAQKVAVYIGPNMDMTSVGLETLQRFCNLSVRSMTAREVQSVEQLFKAPWFTRAWAIQEIYLAKSALVYDDYMTVPWDNLVTAARRLNDGLDITSSGGTYIKWNKLPCALQLHLPMIRTPQSIMQLMQLARACKSTDARDKIYALFGIAPDLQLLTFPLAIPRNGHLSSAALSTRYPIFNDEDDIIGWRESTYFKPSYSISIENTFTLFTSCWISGFQSVDIFCAVQGSESYPRLPSYVADWAAAPKYEVLGLRDGIRSMCPMHLTSLGRRTPWKAEVEFSDDARQLSIKGVPIGLVADIGDTLDLASSKSKSTIRQWWEIVCRRNRSTADSSCSTNNRNAFWRTLIANTDEAGNAPAQDEDEYFQSCAAWLNGHSIEIFFEDVQLPKHALGSFGDRLEGLLSHASHGRRFLMTENQMMGICPPETQIGDTVTILSGGKVPFILRKQGDYYNLIGECYIHGLMNSEIEIYKKATFHIL
jgi:hypothetical protein